MSLSRFAAIVRTVGCLASLVLLLLAGDALAEPKATAVSAARLMVQDGHFDSVDHVAFSPNGKLVLTGSSRDPTARLWDVGSGRQIHTLQGHTRPLTSVAFSPNGKLVLTGSEDNTARLWDVQTGKQNHTLKGHTAAVTSLVFSPDGKHVLTGSNDSTARLWDVRSGEQIHNLQGHTNTISSVAFSPDGKAVLTGSYDRTGRLWDAHTGQQSHTLKGHTSWVSSVAFSPDGKLVLTGSGDRTARLWEVQTGKPGYTFQDNAKIFLVAFSPDGKLFLTGSEGKTARLWDVQTGKPGHNLEGHTEVIESLAFSPDGKLILTGGKDKTARLWEVQTGKNVRTLKDHVFSVSCLAFSPDGKLILIGGLNPARLWEVQTGKPGHELDGQTNPVSGVAFSPDGKRLLIGSHDRRAQFWDVQTGKPGHTLTGHSFPVTSLAFSPDGKRVLTGTGNPTWLWDVQTGKQIAYRSGQKVTVRAAALSPDGNLLLIGADKTARLWDLQASKPIQDLQRHTAPVTSVAFSPDGKFVLTGSEDKTARLWDALTGKHVQVLLGHTSWVESVAFSPDGKLLLTSSKDRTARLWDAQTGKQVALLKGEPSPTYRVFFSPDGKLIGTVDTKARLWDAQTGKQLHTLEGHTGAVLSMAFSPDGKLVLTGSKDRTAQLWDVQTGKPSNTRLEQADFACVCFSPEGKHVLTGGSDKMARLWDAKTGAELCRLVSFSDGTWAVLDAQGRYDASNGGDVAGLHWVVGVEPIALDQLKERYYEPGLLAKKLELSQEPLRQVTTLDKPKLFPDVQLTEPTKSNPKWTILLTNRGGGVGPVVVKLNGKEVTSDVRPKGTDATVATLKIELDLRGDPRLRPGGQNAIEVQAFNAEGYLRSRGMERLFEAEGKVDNDPTQLWAIVVGVSKYGNAALDLRYAAKDAEDFANALQVASTRLFGTDKVRRTLLTTSGAGDGQPTRQNLVSALEAAQKAKPGDVVVIYLAGHGINHGGPDGDFFFLTREAQSADLKDPEVRRLTALSSTELTEYLKKIPAQKQVLILDTCASGKALEKLTEKRDVPGSQVRALERVKDRTGLHILAGCAADAVSYEATRYGQGVLTYSLLEGMRGAKLRLGEYVDVVELFGYAADRVPELARDIGGVQRPVIASPRGAPFDIGRMTPEDQEKIPLRKVRPLVLRANFLEEDDLTDVLALSRRVNEHLRAISATTTRGATLVYVDAEGFPDAFQVSGLYHVNKDKVEVTVRLRRGQDKGERFTVQGIKGKLDDLAARLVVEIEKRLASQ